MISALPADYRKIQDAVARLDTLPLQVMIEATIAEVTLSDQLRYGVEWFFQVRRLRGDLLPASRIPPTWRGLSRLLRLFSECRRARRPERA